MVVADWVRHEGVVLLKQRWNEDNACRAVRGAVAPSPRPPAPEPASRPDATAAALGTRLCGRSRFLVLLLVLRATRKPRPGAYASLSTLSLPEFIVRACRQVQRGPGP